MSNDKGFARAANTAQPGLTGAGAAAAFEKIAPFFKACARQPASSPVRAPPSSDGLASSLRARDRQRSCARTQSTENKREYLHKKLRPPPGGKEEPAFEDGTSTI